MDKKSDPYSYTVGDLDEVVDEKGNTAVMLRELSWGDGPKKIEIRKWFLSENGEKPSKGVTFCTEEGPGNLAKALIRNGFGKTPELLDSMKDREDFEQSLINTIGIQKVKKAKETESDEEFFDPREAFM